MLYSEKFMNALDGSQAPVWVRYFCLAFWLTLCAQSQPLQPGQPPKQVGELIEAVGQPEIYLFTNGEKYHIENPSWIGQNGFGASPIHFLPANVVDAIPNGYPLPEGSGLPGNPRKMALEGKLLQDKEGAIYVVIHGRRHWIRTAHWISESPYAQQGVTPLTDRQLEAIPLGGDIDDTSVEEKIARPLLAVVIFAFFFSGLTGRLKALERFKASRTILAIIFIAAIGLREPYLLQNPRFWAEEGSIWFQYGSTHPIWRTLLFVFPISNYFSLAPNIGAVLSSQAAVHFGLLYAPMATTLYSYLIQALCIVSILVVRSRLFDSLWKAVAGCLIVLFAPTTTDEIWLNSINSMSFLGAITLVILFADTQNWSRATKWVTRGILLFCGLSSPYAVALTPLFLLWAWRSKGREQKIQCAILMICVLVQAGVVLESRRENKRQHIHSVRATLIRPDASAVNIFVEHMLYPSVGLPARELVLDTFGLKESSISALTAPARPFLQTLPLGGWFCFLLIVGILALLRGKSLFSMTNMMLAAFLVLSIFTCIASLYSVPTGRYAFMPGVAFLLLLLLNIDSASSRTQQYICASILSIGLAAGMVAYATPRYQEGPSWQGELAKWEASPAYTPRVWPSFFVSDLKINYPKQTAAK